MPFRTAQKKSMMKENGFLLPPLRTLPASTHGHERQLRCAWVWMAWAAGCSRAARLPWC
jgi:hypothetical protein